MQSVLNLKPVSSLSQLEQQYPKIYIYMKVAIVVCIFVYLLGRLNDLIHVKQMVPSKPIMNASYHYCFFSLKYYIEFFKAHYPILGIDLLFILSGTKEVCYFSFHILCWIFYSILIKDS